jgi:hypothetical protein
VRSRAKRLSRTVKRAHLIFDFPTYAEAYRIAALDIVKQRG